MFESSGFAIGLMSGTSGDGIDAALVKFTERYDSIFPRMELAASHYVPYTEEQRELVFRLFDPNVSARYVAHMHVQMGDWLGQAARELIRKAGLKPRDIQVIGSHGQTVWHCPEDGITLQIGDPTRISQWSGCPVVSNFRSQDVALGGQGAPLVPYFDYAYFKSETVQRVLLNIGGIANITVIPPGATLDAVIAFDTGPGNMVIDALVSTLTQGRQAFDKNGEIASQGTPSLEVVERWLSEDEYLHAKPPKSTGRERYGLQSVASYLTDLQDLQIESQVATMTYFVARTIAGGIKATVRGEFELCIGGGGRHNRTLVKWIEQLCRPLRIVYPESFGIPSDMKEAMAFALLAWQFLRGRPANVISATGARAYSQLGQWTPRPFYVMEETE